MLNGDGEKKWEKQVFFPLAWWQLFERVSTTMSRDQCSDTDTVGNTCGMGKVRKRRLMGMQLGDQCELLRGCPLSSPCQCPPAVLEEVVTAQSFFIALGEKPAAWKVWLPFCWSSLLWGGFLVALATSPVVLSDLCSILPGLEMNRAHLRPLQGFRGDLLASFISRFSLPLNQESFCWFVLGGGL